MPENLTRNSTILASVLMEGSTEFQQLASAASQGRMAEVIAAFDMPNGNKLFQEVTGLFTTIGRTRIHSQRWENPLAFLEGGMMSYGANVREMAVRWAKTRSFASDAQDLLKRRLPSFAEAMHQLDRFEKWEQSISRTEFMQSLQPGIGGDDGTGLDTLLGAIFDAMYSPEAYGSMNYTLQTIVEADRSWGKLNGRGANGLFRVNLPAITDKDTGENFMAALETMALDWRYPSTLYNNMPELPVFTRPDDIVIFVRNDTLGLIDYKTIANLFHAERAEDIRSRIVPVPGFGIPGVRAVMADRNFFVIHRSYFGLDSFYDPNDLCTKYILHSQGVWSASPFANIVLFGDFESTEIPTAKVAPSGLAITPEKSEVEIGGKVGIRATLNGSVTVDPSTASAGGIMVKPDSVVWSVSAPEGVVLNRGTRVDRFGVLHVQKTGIAAGVELVVNAVSTYVNPSGETQTYSATATVTTKERTGEKHNPERDQLAYTDVRDAYLKDDAIEGLGGDAPVNP